MEWVQNGALLCGFLSLYELDVKGVVFSFLCGMVGMECGNMGMRG